MRVSNRVYEWILGKFLRTPEESFSTSFWAFILDRIYVSPGGI